MEYFCQCLVLTLRSKAVCILPLKSPHTLVIVFLMSYFMHAFIQSSINPISRHLKYRIMISLSSASIFISFETAFMYSVTAAVQVLLVKLTAWGAVEVNDRIFVVQCEIDRSEKAVFN